MSTPVVYPAPKLWQRIARWLKKVLDFGSNAGLFQQGKGPRPAVVVLGMEDQAPPPMLALMGQGGSVPYARVPAYNVAISILKGLRTAGWALLAIVGPHALDALFAALSDPVAVTSILSRSFPDQPFLMVLGPAIVGIFAGLLNRRKQLKLKAEVQG